MVYLSLFVQVFISSKEHLYFVGNSRGKYDLRIGYKALTAQVTKAGFYWPIIINDATNLVKWCD